MANEKVNDVNENKSLKILREVYESKDNVSRYSYFIKGVLRGKSVRVSLMPSDVSGYELLDILFLDNSDVRLDVVPYEINDSNGALIKGNTYLARVLDSNGEVFECPVKPRNKSDKYILEMLLNRL